MNDADLRAMARRGGATTKAKHGSEHYRAIGAMGGRASKGKPKTRIVVPIPDAVASGVRVPATGMALGRADLLSIVIELDGDA